jgi:hypothetical protein
MGKIVRRDKVFEDGKAIIKIAIEPEPAVYKIFALRQTLDDIKIDWESSEGYQELTLAEFQATKPTEPVQFRAFIIRSTYYNYDFEDSSVYQCYELTYPGDDSFRIFAYAKRSDEALEPLLSRGKTQAFSGILKLRFLPGSVVSNQVEITEVVATSWWE